MRLIILFTTLAAAFIMFLGGSLAFSQATFKIPFKFEAAGKKLPPGNYLVTLSEEGKITLQKEAGGVEITIAIVSKLEPIDPPKAEPELVFDMVANFEPSYTEYITDYLLAEVWLSAKEGFLVLADERAEYTKNVKGVKQE